MTEEEEYLMKLNNKTEKLRDHDTNKILKINKHRSRGK